MAGMSGYDRVYRGRPQYEENSDKYYNREFIRPLDITSLPVLDDSPSDNDITIKKYVGIGCGLASLITENLLIHPFIVLRRQCQVNPLATTYHLVPITLIPVILRLHQTQGLSTLWKGIGSVLLVRGLTLAVEDVLSKITPWPKEITSQSSIKSIGQHLLLKCVAIGIVTPFYSASLVETVQSEIASEKPGILDVFRDGAIRLLEVGNKGRLIPIYELLAPHAIYGVAKYVFGVVVKSVVGRIMYLRNRHAHERMGAYSKESEGIIQDIELHSAIISMCTADIVFYPLETIIHRLHLQGTRTIIDDLDTGRSVLPLITGYSGTLDCYRSIIGTEGTLGLYKGFGALLLQFGVHFLVLKATKYILIEVGSILRSKPKIPKTPQDIFYNGA